MGGRIAERLLARGYEVSGWNRTSAKAEALAAQGLRVATSPRECASGAEVALSMVTDTAAVEEVATGEEGIIAGLGPGAVWADMSTISPEASRRLAARVADAGAMMVDAPVSGSLTTLEQGQLAIMIGGSEEA